jgi:TonB-dependent receptor
MQPFTFTRATGRNRLFAGMLRTRCLTALTALAAATVSPLSAQEATPVAASPGRLVGRIIDAQSGTGLADAGVQVVGTTIGVQSGVDGRYSVAGIPAGTVTIQVRRLGYAPKTVTGILLRAGQTLEQSVALEPATIRLQQQVVTATSERGTVSEALDAQRNATGIVNAITSEQISKSPDSDAAQAVQRVSGVTVQDGRFVFVRGLGERYTSTSLNGARIPSPEPERKVVPLDLFPSSLLQSVTTSKTFTPDQSGDFSGALVDLRTREFPGRRQVSYSATVGYNSRATGRDILTAPREGMEWLGFSGSRRGLPGIVAAAGNISGNYSPDQYNGFVRSFRNAWSAQERSGAPNTSMSVSVGGNDPVLGRRVGYVGSLSYSRGTEVRADEIRAFPIPTPDGGTQEVDRYDGSTGRESVLWGGLLNLSALVGSANRITLNNTYSRSADNEARNERGIDENTGLTFQIDRLRYIERSVWSSQLAGEHEASARHRLQWQATAARVTRVEPDRSEVVYAMEDQTATPFLFGSSEGAVRTFGDLKETSVNAGGDYTLRFGGESTPHLIKIGGLFRYTSRDAVNNSYSLQATLPREDRERQPEEIFDGRFAGPGSNLFRVVALSQGGSYDASDALGAGYAMLEYDVTSRLRFIGGARVESQSLEVTAQPLFGNAVKVSPTYTDVLPSAALTARLTEAQNLRLSVSQTLARPEYREIVPIASRDVIGGEQFRGNANLKRTLIQNADLRWEWYPNAGEVVSVGVFAKRFDDPIERVYRGTSGTRVTTFENASEATNVGAEFEFRKGLGFLAKTLDPLTLFSNATLMTSSIDLRNVGAGSVDADRPMVGQAPYVANAGLTYASSSGRLSATTLYNVVGRRIFAASLLPLPNVYEESRHVVDFSLRFPIAGSMGGRFDARNLLDAPYEVTQGSVTRERYRAGRVMQFGLSWRH